MCTRSAPATAPAAEAATNAPADSSALALASVRFHTVTSSPRFKKPCTIALPSSPVPINATFAITSLPVQSTAVPELSTIAVAMLIVAAPVVGVVSAAEPPRVLRWAGDPEGGAPFVEADPSHPDRVTGFDVEIADLLARGLGRSAAFLNITFTSIDQSIARGDADIGMSGIEDTPTRRATLAV